MRARLSPSCQVRPLPLQQPYTLFVKEVIDMTDNATATNSIINLAAQGAASVTDPNALRGQMRRELGATPPPIVDVTSWISNLLPAAIPPVSTFTTPVLPSLGQPHCAIAAILSQGGTLTLSRYVNSLGELLSGTVVQQVTAGSAAVLDSSASSLYQSWSVAISNTAASAATLSSFCAVLGSK